jgi:DNA-binding transcriptional ArsR family regulator
MPDDLLEVVSSAQFKALAHPTRHRILYALDTPATISQLAARLAINKGNVAHHLKVLVAGGLVREAATRQVRGGTERYVERTARAVKVSGDHLASQFAAAMSAVADELAAAAPDPLLTIRHLRLTAAQAATLREALSALVTDVAPAGEDEHRYGVLVGLYQQSPAADATQPEISNGR